MKAPYSYYGNKSEVAPLIWQRFGNPQYFADPFGGSFSMLLNRPAEHKLKGRRETVGDLDCMIAHFWRAIKNDPEGVAYYAFDPVSQIELHTRNKWLMGQRELIHQMLGASPDWYDAKIAGWWCWGKHLFAGPHWCHPKCNLTSTLPYVRTWHGYRVDTPEQLASRFKELSVRLRNVLIIQGDWHETIAKGLLALKKSAIKGVLLDPPYTKRSGRKPDLYVCDSFIVGDRVAAWARLMGRDKTYRIALCGLEDEYDLPGWSVMGWKKNERIWFSPGCLPAVIESAA